MVRRCPLPASPTSSSATPRRQRVRAATRSISFRAALIGTANPIPALEPEVRMVQEWQAAGITAQALTKRGQEAEAQGPEAAERWYRRARLLEGEMGANGRE